jgi:hypothetical protein
MPQESLTNKTIRSFFIAATLLGLAAVLPARAVTLSLVPSGPYTVSAGDSLSVDVIIGDLGSEIVSAFNLDVAFDPAVLAFGSVNFELAPWGGGADVLTDVQFVSGLIDDIALVSLLSDAELAALQSPLGGSFKLFNMGFNAVADGSTDLAFVWGPGNDIKGAENQRIFAASEPASALLLMLGCAGLGCCKRTAPLTSWLTTRVARSGARSSTRINAFTISSAPCG